MEEIYDDTTAEDEVLPLQPSGAITTSVCVDRNNDANTVNLARGCIGTDALSTHTLQRNSNRRAHC